MEDDETFSREIEVEAEMTASLLRANVKLEYERDQARDEVEQLTTQLKDLRADLEVWQTKYQQGQLDLTEAEKRLAARELDYDKLSSKCDVCSSTVSSVKVLMCAVIMA